ncbi:hypothetical protein AURDEDRAFT_165704 [Auricularia subglabra TFB-10046 SS5]|nr:hypothetical protein AURDEDRAFT_165704 [Auricularia subglabra TFB-10046 SS5]
MAPTAQPVPDCFEVTRNAAGSAVSFRCTICNSNELKCWKDHYNGATHKKRASQLEERKEAHMRVERAYRDAVAAPLNAVSDVQMNNPMPTFDPDLSGLAVPSHSVDVSRAEAQAMLEAVQTESAEEYRARVNAAMAELIARAGWMQVRLTVCLLFWILNLGIDDTVPTEEEVDHMINSLVTNTHGGWFPYPQKTWTILHLLRIIPRMRLSDSQFKLILWAMCECGARDVPSFYALHKLEAKLRTSIGAATVQHTSELGNVFYSNDIRDTISMELCNPQVAEHLVFYPELNAPAVSEVWQATRWTELPPDMLTPMIRVGAHDFFIGELAQLSSGSFVIPCMWFTRGNVLFGRCLPCAYDSAANQIIVGPDDERINVPESEFVRTFTDLVQAGNIPDFLGERSLRFRAAMPNRLRKEAAGTMLYSVILNVWADDVSGNVSKQYNKHINVCVSNMCLPVALLQQEYFVRFFSTSPSVSSAEQLDVLKQQILATHETPFATFDARTGQQCKFRLVVQALPGDNPQQSDNCSHLGLKANLNCRRCFNTTQIPEELSNNFDCGVADRVANKQTETGVKDPIAEHWVDGLIAKARELKATFQRQPDNPSIPRTEEEVAEHLQKWLEAQPALRASYIMQYKNNLIGRHFKALLQLQVFHTHEICTPERFTLIKATGALAAFLWFTEIKEMEQYLADLRILIANVLDAYTAINPTRILIKAKLHVLPHLPDDIRRFGPAVRSATEIFECFNAIFRICSVLSNHRSPSRDIATSLADMDCAKHIFSGGFWWDDEAKQIIWGGFPPKFISQAL